MPKVVPENRPTAEDIKRMETEWQCVELRKAGVSYENIAKKLGLGNASCALQMVRRALSRVDTEATKDLRDLETRRLDDMLFSIWGHVRKGHFGAIEKALKIMERRARLLGLDSPVKFDGNMTQQGGVMLVPAGIPAEEWAALAAPAQSALQQERKPDGADNAGA